VAYYRPVCASIWGIAHKGGRNAFKPWDLFVIWSSVRAKAPGIPNLTPIFHERRFVVRFVRYYPLALVLFLTVLVLSTHLVVGDAIACSLNCPFGDNTVGGPSNHTPGLNGDGFVGVMDLAMFAVVYVQGPYDSSMDYNCDGVISITDFAIFAAHYFHAGVPDFCIP
jgi:hypothetical protein